MKIIIETIPHDQQRYPTVGDWFVTQEPKFIENQDGFGTREPSGTEEILHIKVSKMQDWRHEVLVGLHELVECVICRRDGVSQEEVDKFDMDFEANRHPDSIAEPGDSPNAPYFKQHGIASGVERVVGAELGVDWNQYADEVEAFP